MSLASCGGGGGGNGNAPAPNNPVATPIYEVQGSGASSPLTGQAVVVEGVVTGDFQDGDGDDTRNLGGFYIQNLPDADFATSDGVFVFDGGNPSVDVNAGDFVRVDGVVNEFFGETQISASSVTVNGVGRILPAPINLPALATTTNNDGDIIADLERYEGMLIRFPQTLTVSALLELERMGEVLLTHGGRPYQFTNRNAPDVAGYDAYREALAARRILLDDGLRAANATPIRYLTAGVSRDYSIRVGDQVTDVTGVLRYSRGSGSDGTEAYRLMPTTNPQFESTNPRPGAPRIGGAVRLASFNVLNFFSGIDSGQPDCGPRANANCRGADSAAELTRQLGKIVTALHMLDADVVGLIELENNASESLQQIVDALNTRVGAGTYAYVDTGTIGDDAIKTGFVYKPVSVSLVGAAAILDSTVDSRFDDTRNRPALAQTFAQNSDNARVTIIVNHLKSKGSDCDAAGDPNLGDGQGNCNRTRSNAAAAMAGWVAADPTLSGDPDFLIIGDLNAYMLEDPVTTLRTAGFTNLTEATTGPDTYSFVFDGQSGALDHALASASLAPQVVEVLEWHINADEPPVLDYNLESGRDPGLFDSGTPYRASDHDPLIIGLDLTP
ncbi:MAG: ExeM/NucH family extracellular endonuclease [Gammaproteobacteria bacterium]|nr:ExeM/NucH family extracellular endonuclease [Gammaproteobacteria bacterium]MDH3410487.1 ExeM/NucH family extracellular endonuclease [Gammaproteobacteria bacterium]